MPIRNDKSNDCGNEMVKVCSNRTTIIKEHEIVIIGDSQSRGCAMRVKIINLMVWLNQKLVLIY